MIVTNEDLQRQVANVGSTVASVGAELVLHAAMDTEHFTAINLALGKLETGHAEIKTGLSRINASAWRAVGALALLLVPAIVWMFIQIWPVQARIATTDAATSLINARQSAILERLDKIAANKGKP